MMRMLVLLTACEFNRGESCYLLFSQGAIILQQRRQLSTSNYSPSISYRVHFNNISRIDTGMIILFFTRQNERIECMYVAVAPNILSL